MFVITNCVIVIICIIALAIWDAFYKEKVGVKKIFSLAPLAKLSPDFQNRGTALDNNNGVNSQSVRCVGLIKADDAVSYGGEFAVCIR